MESGRITLPEELQRERSMVIGGANLRLTSTKQRTSGIFSRLADKFTDKLWHRRERPSSAPHSRGRGSVSESISDGASDTVRINVASDMWDVSEGSLSRPSSPGTPDPGSPGVSKKRRGSIGNRLQTLRDNDGLDSPTIVRYHNSGLAFYQRGKNQADDQAEASPTFDHADTGNGKPCVRQRRSNSVPELKPMNASSIAARRKVPELKSVKASKLGSRRFGSQSTGDLRDAGDPAGDMPAQDSLSQSNSPQPMSPMTPDSQRRSKRCDPLTNRLKELRDHDGLDSPTLRRWGSDSNASDNGTSRPGTSRSTDLSVASSIASRRENRESLTRSWRDELSDDVWSLLKLDASTNVNDIRAKARVKPKPEPRPDENELPKGTLRHGKSYRTYPDPQPLSPFQSGARPNRKSWIESKDLVCIDE